jgi:hypothetical protein
MWKILGIFGPFFAYAIFFIFLSGVDSTFAREIGQPPQAVASALYNVDMVRQPQTHARLSAADRRRLPDIRLQRNADGFTWFVMGEGRTVLAMTARLEPVDGGARTYVETEVAAGEAPDAPGVPDLFRSPGEMAPLFAVAVERALGDYIPRSERSPYSLQERRRKG